MKTIRDIRAVLYDRTADLRDTLESLRGAGDMEFIGCSGEDGLDKKINELRESGYRSKEVLILKEFRGRFFQMCPGSPGVICCNYRVINTCFNCLYNCAYCFLNSYLNAFGIVQFTNTEKIFDEIDSFIRTADADMVYRIGSGEYTDSLMMDASAGFAGKLIKRYSRAQSVMIELKTKSNNVGHLLSIDDKGRAVLSWSMNTEKNVSLYENDAAPIEERLSAAGAACRAGYYIAFHLDPIIIYDGWEDDYKRLVEKMLSSADPERVVWISMGGFRYSPGFKDDIRDKFPDEKMTAGEMFPGIDGKFRYLKRKRVDIYRKIRGYIGNITDKPFLYMCMESPDVWESVFGRRYTSSAMLERDFSDHLKRNFFGAGDGN